MPDNEKDFQREVLDRLIKIEGKLDSYEKTKDVIYANKEELVRHNNRLVELEKDVQELKDNSKWLSRTVTGLVLGIVVAVVVGCIKMGIGV